MLLETLENYVAQRRADAHRLRKEALGMVPGSRGHMLALALADYCEAVAGDLEDLLTAERKRMVATVQTWIAAGKGVGG